MSVKITYEGQLRCKAVDANTGAIVLTDAPAAYEGSAGEYYAPTDMVAVALGTCILTIMAVTAQKNKVSIDGAQCTVEKEMASSGERRISRITLAFTLPEAIPSEKRGIIEHAVHSCPVGRSLHPDIKIEAAISYGGLS